MRCVPWTTTTVHYRHFTGSLSFATTIFKIAQGRVRAGASFSYIVLKLSLLPMSFLGASATVPYSGNAGASTVSDVREVSRWCRGGRTGVATTFSFDEIYLHDALLVWAKWCYYRSVQSTKSDSVGCCWTTGVRQWCALSMREHRGEEMMVGGAQLHALLLLFTLECSDEH